MDTFNRFILLSLLPTFLLLMVYNVCQIARAETVQNLGFKVFLDDREIGRHTFDVIEREEGHEVLVNADFEVKVLFFTAYEYQHNNVETWKDGCLQKINSTTDDNGKDFQVQGERKSGHFSIKRDLPKKSETAEQLPTCVMSFAYWDSAILQQDKLLNSQDGSYLDVEIEALGQDQITVREASVEATRYRLKAAEKDLQIDLWYSANNDWLRLESNVPNRDARLIYELD